MIIVSLNIDSVCIKVLSKSTFQFLETSGWALLATTSIFFHRVANQFP